MGTRKNKHLWCVCDRARDGHWVSTQGNHSDHSLAHPNALKPGFAISSTNKQYVKDAKPPKAQDRKAAASSSSTGSTLAEADLRIAKDNIEDLHKQITELVAVRDELHLQLHKSVDLGNQQLSTAARTANDMAHAHAKQLRTTKAITSDAIAKMKAMRQHAHGFAELMLPHVAADKAPDHIACWAAFSGLLDDDAIKSADWDERKVKKPSDSSAAVYDITEFDKFTGPATMNSPAPNVPYHLTVAKAKAPELPADYEPLDPVDPIKVTFKGKGKGPANAKKRKRDDSDDDNDNDEDDDGSGMDDDGSGSRRYRTEKSVSYERWPFEPPSKVSRPPPCGSTGSSANRTRRTDLHLRVCADGDL